MKNFCAVVILTLISVLPAYAGKWSTGTTAPATCTVGDSWTDTNGTADNRFYTCTSANTWTLNSNQTAIDAKANKAGSVMSWSEWGDGASFTTGSPPVAYNGSLYKCIAPYTKVAGETPDTQTEYFAEVVGVGGGIAHAPSDGNYYASRNGEWANLSGVFASPLGVDDNYVTDAEKTKLGGIAEGAEVNVNSDWNASSGDSQILNKPTIPTVINDLSDVDSTGKATGKILKFDSSGNLVVGNGDTGSGSVPSGTVNGQVLIWATDQWVASASPWLTTALLSTENTWTAVQNFNFGLTATGLTQDLNSWGDWTFDDVQIVNPNGSGDNHIWPASKVILELAGKENAAGNPAVNGYCWQSTTTGARSWGPCGSGGSFTFDTFPIYSDSPHSSGIAVNDTHVAIYSGPTNGWGISALTFSLSPSPITYALDLTISGVLGLDKISVNGSDYSASAVIPGLSSATTAITASADTGRQAVCSGDNTGAYPNYLVDMSAGNKVVSCVFSTAPVASFYGAPGSTESFGSGAFDLPEFSEVDPNTKVALDTTYAHTGSYGATFTTGGLFGTEYIRANLGQLEDSYTIEWWIKSPAPSGDYTLRYFYSASSSTTPGTTTYQTVAIGWRGAGSGAQHLYMAPLVGGTSVNSTILTASTEYRFSLAVTRNSASVLSVYDTSGTLVTSLTVTAPDRQSQYFYWSAYPEYSIDDIKFNSTNP